MYRQTNHGHNQFPDNFPSGNPFNDPFFTTSRTAYSYFGQQDSQLPNTFFPAGQPHVYPNNPTVTFRSYQESRPLQHLMNPTNAARSTWTPPTVHTYVPAQAQTHRTPQPWPTNNRESTWMPPSVENDNDSDQESSFSEMQTSTWFYPLLWLVSWFAECFYGNSDCFDDDAELETRSANQPAVAHGTRLPQEPSAAAWKPLYRPAAASPVANHTLAPVTTQPNTNEVLKLSNCSLHVQEYVLNQTKKFKLSDRVKALELTTAEEELFEKFKDPISLDYMDVPVSVHETFFDITTIFSFTKQENPCTRTPFKPLEIQSARSLVNECEDAIHALLHQREQRPKC